MAIITQKEPFTKEQVEKLLGEFPEYIKTVIDIDKKICSAGANRHFESEEALIKQGSKQNDLWGGGVDVETKEINIDSMINIRPALDNRSNQIQDPAIREKFEELTRYFFPTIFNEA
ncbi:MAG TPA: DUF5674 family protein [Candidatus Saccharimonadales bacterium]|nr:DUF5674 family protein [Candidatus Saccharimonadales bacterium]